MWRRRPKRKLSHLVDFSGEMTRPAAVAPPPTNVRITVPGAAQPAKARRLVTPQSLPVRRTGNSALQVTLPRAAEYEGAVFEK